MWVNKQRTVYKAGSLEQNRIDRLNSFGFKWILREKGPMVPWETRFNELVQYKTNRGHSSVLKSHIQLGTWVRQQRQQYKKNRLAQDRIDHLDSIGFDWTPLVGSRKRKSLSSIKQNRSSSRNKRASLRSTTVESPSVGAGAETIIEGLDETPVPVSLSISIHNPNGSYHNCNEDKRSPPRTEWTGRRNRQREIEEKK